MAPLAGFAAFWLDKPLIAIHRSARRGNGIADNVEGFGWLLRGH